MSNLVTPRSSTPTSTVEGETAEKKGSPGGALEWDTGGLPDHIALLVRPPLKSMFYAVVDRLALEHNSRRAQENVQSMMLLSGCERGDGGVPSSYLKRILKDLYQMCHIKGVGIKDETQFVTESIEESITSFQEYRQEQHEKNISGDSASDEAKVDRAQQEIERINKVKEELTENKDVDNPTKVDYAMFEGLCMRLGCQWSRLVSGNECSSLPDAVRKTSLRLLRRVKLEKQDILPNCVPPSRSSVEPTSSKVGAWEFLEEAEKAVPLSLEVTAELCGVKVQGAVDRAQAQMQNAMNSTNFITSNNPRMVPTSITQSLTERGVAQILDARSGGAEVAVKEGTSLGANVPTIDTYPQEWAKHRDKQLAHMTHKINASVTRYQQHLAAMTEESSFLDPSLPDAAVEPPEEPETANGKLDSSDMTGQSPSPVRGAVSPTPSRRSVSKVRVTVTPFKRQGDTTKMMKGIVVAGGISENGLVMSSDRCSLKRTLAKLKDRRVNELRYARRVQEEIQQVTEKTLRAEQRMADNWVKDRQVPLPQSMSHQHAQSVEHETKRMQRSQRVQNQQKQHQQRVPLPMPCCNVYDSVCEENASQQTTTPGGAGTLARGDSPQDRQLSSRGGAPQSYFATLTGAEGSWLDDVRMAGKQRGEPVDEAEILVLYTEEQTSPAAKASKVDCWREPNEEEEREEIAGDLLNLLQGGDESMKHSKYPDKNSGAVSSEHVKQQRRRVARHLAVLATSTTKRPTAKEAVKGTTTEPPCLRDSIKQARHDKKVDILTGEVGMARLSNAGPVFNPFNPSNAFNSSSSAFGNSNLLSSQPEEPAPDLDEADFLAEPLRDADGFIMTLQDELEELARRKKEEAAIRRDSMLKNWRPRGSIVGGFQPVPQRRSSTALNHSRGSKRPSQQQVRPAGTAKNEVKSMLTKKSLDWSRVSDAAVPSRKKKGMF